MELKTKLELFKLKGWKYNPDTGEVFSHTGKRVNGLTGKGYKTGKGYICCAIKTKNGNIQVKAHQLAWYLTYKEVPNQIDHIDRVTTNNRISNLRNVTNQQNSFNRNVKGVSYHKRVKKWQVRIGIDGVRIHLGYFKDFDEALLKYGEAKKIYHKIESN